MLVVGTTLAGLGLPAALLHPELPLLRAGVHGPAVAGLSSRLQPGHHRDRQSLVSPQARPGHVDRPDRPGHRRGPHLSRSWPSPCLNLGWRVAAFLSGSPCSRCSRWCCSSGARRRAWGSAGRRAPPRRGRTRASGPRRGSRGRPGVHGAGGAAHADVLAARRVSRPPQRALQRRVRASRALLVWKGLDEPTAAFYVGLTALSTVVVRPLTGWLGDHRSKQMIGATGVVLGAVGLVVLCVRDAAAWPLVVFAVLVLVRRRDQFRDVGAGGRLLRPERTSPRSAAGSACSRASSRCPAPSSPAGSTTGPELHVRARRLRHLLRGVRADPVPPAAADARRAARRVPARGAVPGIGLKSALFWACALTPRAAGGGLRGRGVTSHACAAPLGLGSIRARGGRRRLEGKHPSTPEAPTRRLRPW